MHAALRHCLSQLLGEVSLSSRTQPGHISLGSFAVFGRNVRHAEPVNLAVHFLCNILGGCGWDRNAYVLRLKSCLLSLGFVHVPGTWCWLLDVPCSVFISQVPIL